MPSQKPAAGAAPPELSVVVVTFRRPQLLQECLESVRLALEQLAGEAEVIVVDNGSQDETGELVRDRLGVRLITIRNNVGFTAGVSRGIHGARGAWIALLNDDVTVDPETFRALLAVGRTAPDVGAVAAQMRFADRPATINSAGIEIDRLGVAADRLLGQPAEASEREPVEVFGVSGGAALYRREMLQDVDGFDESFFAYLEDVDLAWRARMRGWRALYAPAAVVHHHHSATLIHGSPQKYYLVGRNRVRLLAKNATTRQLVRYGSLMLAYDLAYVAFVVATRRTLKPVRGRLAGLREWRRYRAAGAAIRRDVPLAPLIGLRRALARNRTWRSQREGT